MKKKYKKRKDENLAQWIDRMTEEILLQCSDWDNYRPKLHEMLSELSKTSYIAGVHAEREVSAKFGGRIK